MVGVRGKREGVRGKREVEGDGCTNGARKGKMVKEASCGVQMDIVIRQNGRGLSGGCVWEERGECWTYLISVMLPSRRPLRESSILRATMLRTKLYDFRTKHLPFPTAFLLPTSPHP